MIIIIQVDAFAIGNDNFEQKNIWLVEKFEVNLPKLAGGGGHKAIELGWASFLWKKYYLKRVISPF